MSESKSCSGILAIWTLCLCSLLLLSACSTENLKLNFFAGKTISGSVEPFVESSTSSKVSRQTTCPQIQVELYQIAADGTEILPPLESTEVDSNGEYSFSEVDNIGVYSQSVDGVYKAIARGCGETYSRFITGRDSQIISYGSSLIAFVLNSDQRARVKNAIKQTQGQKVQELTSLLEAQESYQAAYDFLNNNEYAKSLFHELFEGSVTILAEAAPVSQPEGLPDFLNEHETYTLSANSTHWNQNYDLVYQWKKGAVVLSTSPSFSYTAGANDQDSEVIFTLYVGQNDGSGDVDLSKPYRSYEYKREIKNTVLPQVPAISLGSSSNTSNTTVYVQVSTGALLAHCESFSDLAFTENTLSPPTQTDFDTQNLSCQQSGTQLFSYTLADTSDGAKSIRLWSRDASGQISQNFRVISMTLNSSAPSLDFTSPAANSAASTGLTLTGTCDDSFPVDISGTGVSSSLAATCSGGVFSQTITFSAGDGTKSIILSQTDLASNTVSASRVFVKDSVAPVISLSSPAANTVARNGLTLTGVCEDGLAVNFSGSGLPAPISASCSGGSFSQAITFSAGDGAKAITVSQTDAAGNTATTSRSFVRDTVAPTLAVTSPAADTPAQTGVTLTGTCESGLTVNISGAGVSSPSSVSCSGGSFSQAITFSAGDGVKAITVSQTDTAGNAGTVSRNFIRDTIAPAIAVTSPAVNTPAQNGVTLSGSCESGLTVNLSGTGLSSAGSTICSGGSFSHAISFSAGEGTKSITISQTDTAGNVGTSSRDFVRDTTEPLLSITSPAASTAAQTGVTLTGSCESGLTINLSGTGLSTPSTTGCSGGSFSQAIVFSAGEGAKAVTLTQTDAAGNTGTLSRNFIRDTTAPLLSFTTPAANTSAQTGLTVTGSCEDGITISLSGSGLSSPVTTNCGGGSFSRAVTFSAGDGIKSISLSQTDQAGNIGTVSRDFVKDTTAPSLSFTSPALGTEAQTGVTIAGACEADLTLNISGAGLSSPLSTNCSGGNFSQAIVFSSGDGTKTIEISQTDTAGNTGTAARDFIRDTAEPVLTFSSPATNTSAQSGLTLTGACEDGLSISLSGSGLASPSSAVCSFGGYSQAISFTPGEGIKTVTISQTDDAGNIGSISRDFIRDNTDPIITIASPAAGFQTQSSLTLAGTCETGIDITYSGNILSTFTSACVGGNYSQTVFLSAGDGAKTVTVTQTDEAGNTASVSRSFTRDTQAPVMTQTSLSFPYYSNTNTVTFGGSCESGYDVVVEHSGSSIGTASCNGTWSFALPPQSTDATRDYTFKQTDAAGNEVTTLGRWVRDTVAPTLSFSSSSSPVTATDSVTFSGSCEAGLPLPISVGGTDTATTNCNSGTWTYTVASQTSDSTRAYSFTLVDRASNQTEINGSWQRNTQLPVLQVTSASRVANDQNQASFSGDCESGLDIEIRRDGTLENTISCAGSFSYSVDSQTTDASRTYEFKQTNASLLSTAESVTWIRDTTGPVFSLNQMLLNDGSPNTSLARISIDSQVVDALTAVTHLCFKTEDTAPPSDSDSCFISVEDPSMGLTPALTLNLDNYGYTLPITPSTYAVYGWAKDEVGNVSSLTNAGAGTDAQDRASITYTLPIPPQVSRVSASSGDAPANPLSEADLTVGAGQPIYIKWKASDDSALPSDAVSVYFTTDDNTYTLVASGLSDGQNGACSIDNASTPADDDMTGCYYWASAPVSGFLRVRVIVKDTEGLEAGMTATPLNIAGKMRFLAGNTDLGTNLSSRAAMFLSRRESDFYGTDTQTLAVTRDGTVYFKDRVRGILKVSPSDGVQRVFLRQTGSSTGDNGSVTSATAKNILKIALDHNQPVQRLWLYDYDRIRRINLETGTIETVIGGGSDTSDTVSNALDLKMDWFTSDPDGWHSRSLFFALPNGDFYFQSGNDGYYDKYAIGQGYRIRKYKASDQSISSFAPTSITSTSGRTAADLGDCRVRGAGMSYNPSTSEIVSRILSLRLYFAWSACNSYGDESDLVSLNELGESAASHPDEIGSHWRNDRLRFISGLDGRLYALDRTNVANGLMRYNDATGEWTKLLGGASNINGQCDDETDALSCATYISDAFIQEDGTIYFLDNGRIRTINANNQVITLMGQGITEADEVPSLAARLGTLIRYFHLRDNGGITFSNSYENKIYEFEPGGQSYLIAGDGSLATASTSVDSDLTPVNLEWGWNSADRFGMDPATGEIYHHSGSWNLRKLVRNTSAIGSAGRWQDFIGYGSNHWADPNSDGGADISFNLDCDAFGYDGAVLYGPSCWSNGMVLGVFNGKVVVHKSEGARITASGSEVHRNSSLKAYDLSSKVQSHLIGSNQYHHDWNSLCADGTSVADCLFPAMPHHRIPSLHFDPVDGKYFFARNNSSQLHYFSPAGTLQSTYMSHGIRSFAYRRVGTDEYIYYCSNTTGALRRRHLNTSTEVALDWPVSSMNCHTGSMHWSSVRNSLIFLYIQNGLMGFAEYLDPTP